MYTGTINAQYAEAARQTVMAYFEIFGQPLISQGGSYSEPIHLDGTGSPVVGSYELESGRWSLMESTPDGRRVILVAKGGQKPSYRNTPTEDFKGALEERILEHDITVEAMDKAITEGMMEYASDKTPVGTFDESLLPERYTTQMQSPSDVYARMGMGITEPKLINQRHLRRLADEASLYGVPAVHAETGSIFIRPRG